MALEPDPLSPRTRDLIHQVADGSASPEETRELEAILQDAPEALREFKGVKALVDQLNAVRALPTPNLAPAILEQIRSKTPTVLPFQPAPKRSALWMKMGWGLAAATLLGYVALHQKQPAPEEATGTMGGLDYSHWPTVAQAEETPDQGHSALTVRQSGDRYFVQARVESPGQTPVTIRWDRDRFLLINIRPGDGFVSAQTGFGEVVLGSPHSGMVNFVLGRREGVDGSGTLVMTRNNQTIVSTTLP